MIFHQEKNVNFLWLFYIKYWHFTQIEQMTIIIDAISLFPFNAKMRHLYIHFFYNLCTVGNVAKLFLEYGSCKYIKYK